MDDLTSEIRFTIGRMQYMLYTELVRREPLSVFVHRTQKHIDDVRRRCTSAVKDANSKNAS